MTYGEGFGQEYSPPSQSVQGQVGRHEKVITRVIEGKRVTIRVREFVAPSDPLILLMKASLYTRQVPGSRFPVPPISRRIKEALIRRAE